MTILGPLVASTAWLSMEHCFDSESGCYVMGSNWLWNKEMGEIVGIMMALILALERSGQEHLRVRTLSGRLFHRFQETTQPVHQELPKAITVTHYSVGELRTCVKMH